MLQSTRFSPAGRYHTSVAWCLTAECPQCGNALVVRHARHDHRPFIGCQTYPLCKFTCEYDPVLQQLASGQERSASDARLIDYLHHEHEMLTQSHARLLQRNAALAMEVAHWKGLVSATARPTQETLTKTLTHLITLAHPDRWAQGQPATALAHELTTALLALRTQLQKGR